MLDTQITSIIDTLTERTVSRRESITLKDIISADMPRGVKAYIRAEVTMWLKADLAATPRFARINRSAPGVGQLTDAFLRSLSNAYQFSRTEYLTILNDSVKFVASYLCRPRWTLESFVFERAKNIPVEEVLGRLEYTADYAYFKRLIETLIRQWGWHEVTVQDFHLLVSRVDNQILRQHSARELAMLTKPIYDFIALGEASLSSAIPLEPLLAFFGDKGMDTLKEHIESATALRNRSELTLSELVELIEDLTGKEATSSETVVIPAVEEGVPADDVTAPLPEEAIESPLAAAEPAPLPEPPPIPASPATPSPARPVAMADLTKVISSKKKDLFIRKIFRKDILRYDTVIRDLNAMTSWKDASAYLSEFYQINEIDPFTEEVVEFTDLIQSRFTPADVK